jgi:hypothetical protein
MGERRFLDQPYVLELVTIERLQELLRTLADPALTPLPQRLRRRFDAMHGHLQAIKRELETRPGPVAQERAAEDRRSSP